MPAGALPPLAGRPLAAPPRQKLLRILDRDATTSSALFSRHRPPARLRLVLHNARKLPRRRPSSCAVQRAYESRPDTDSLRPFSTEDTLISQQDKASQCEKEGETGKGLAFPTRIAAI